MCIVWGLFASVAIKAESRASQVYWYVMMHDFDWRSLFSLVDFLTLAAMIVLKRRNCNLPARCKWFTLGGKSEIT